MYVYDKISFFRALFGSVSDDKYFLAVIFKGLLDDTSVKFRFVNILLYHKPSHLSISITPFREKVKLPHKSAGVLAHYYKTDPYHKFFRNRSVFLRQRTDLSPGGEESSP